MIRINVKESKKFKDFQYCLFIKCSFDIDIVSKFRKLEFRYFHVNSDCWEIAPIHLQAVKNILINQEYQIIGEELLQNDLGDFTFKTNWFSLHQTAPNLQIHSALILQAT